MASTNAPKNSAPADVEQETGEVLETGTEIVQVADVAEAAQVANLIENFADAKGAIYTTVQGDDQETRLAVMGAISGAEKIDEHIDEVISLKDFVIQAIEVADQESGAINATTRVVLIDADGNAYAGISAPLVSSLQLLTQLVGHPSTWDKPVDVVVERITTRRGYKAFNLVPAGASKKHRAKK